MASKKFATLLEDDVLDELKRHSKESKQKISTIVNSALEDYLQKARVRPAFRKAMDQVIEENSELLRRLAK